MESTVCRYFQTGFCKHSEKCRKQHVQEVCSSSLCKDKSCTKRHPKPCKHFTTFSICKFGNHCAYKHEVSKEQIDYMKLVTTVTTLETQVQDMSVKISNLEKELQNKNIKEASIEKKVKCDKCNYTANSNTVMKRHNSTKHRSPSRTTPEKVRDTSHNDSLQLSPITSEGSEEILPSFMECDTSLQLLANQTSSSPQFKCDLCKHESESEVALHGHKSLAHDKNIPHTAKWDQNKCHICNNAFTKTNDFKYHMIKQHGFENNSDKCMNCEGTDVGIYRPMPFQSVFMNCKECELIKSEW